MVPQGCEAGPAQTLRANKSDSEVRTPAFFFTPLVIRLLVGLTVVVFATLGSGALGEAYGADTASSDGVRLPAPSNFGQPGSSPIQATSWTVRSIAQGRRKVGVSGDAVVLFDWGTGVGESVVHIVDGCGKSTRTFNWTFEKLVIGPATFVETNGKACSQSDSGLQRALAGTFTHGTKPALNVGTSMVLTRGRTRIELIRRAESSLNGTAWRTIDKISRAGITGEPLVEGTLSFGPTRFAAYDGCNSVDGTYLVIGDRLVSVGNLVSTAVFCKVDVLGWKATEAKFSRTAESLIITSGSQSHTYRRVTTIAYGTPYDQPDPTATAPFATTAAYGSWKVESLQGRKTGPGAVGTIEFRGDGSFQGQTPCEFLTGTWTQAATTMATTIRDLVRKPTLCDESLKPDALALGDLLATGQLAVGRGDIRLTLWRAGTTDLSLGITFVKA